VKTGILGSILLVWIILPNDSAAQTRRTAREPSLPILGVEAARPDTGISRVISEREELAKRVDSLQLYLIEHAESLKESLDRRIIWVYALLGIIIVACMIIYGTLSAGQRQGKELEDRISRQVAATVSQLENQIRNVEAGMKSKRPPPRLGARRAKKSR
jgi:anti-sigma-K factor RskA